MATMDEIIQGFQTEYSEHPDMDPYEALGTAMDHIDENPNYYRRMELSSALTTGELEEAVEEADEEEESKSRDNVANLLIALGSAVVAAGALYAVLNHREKQKQKEKEKKA